MDGLLSVLWLGSTIPAVFPKIMRFLFVLLKPFVLLLLFVPCSKDFSLLVQLLNKFHVVANYEGRSVNGQIMVLIRDSIEAYEAKHGEIKFETKKSPK